MEIKISKRSSEVSKNDKGIIGKDVESQMKKGFDLNTVKTVECLECKELHRTNSEGYLTVYGNICIGKSGGILGGGSWENEGIPVNTLCIECFVEFIRKYN